MIFSNKLFLYKVFVEWGEHFSILDNNTDAINLIDSSNNNIY
jgi:hypothetical protein